MEETKDCLKCRLTSGGGLIAGGAYVVHQSKKVKTFSRRIITLIGCGLGILGILRIFALPPFQIKSEVQKGTGEKTVKLEVLKQIPCCDGKEQHHNCKGLNLKHHKSKNQTELE